MNEDLLGYNRSLKDYVEIWITDGREIENYIPWKLLVSVLSMDLFRKKWINLKESGKTTRIELEVKPEIMDKESFGKFDSFDQAFTNLYSRKDGIVLNNSQREIIAKHLSSKKVDIAREVSKLWDAQSFVEPLNTKMERIVSIIKKANGLLT